MILTKQDEQTSPTREQVKLLSHEELIRGTEHMREWWLKNYNEPMPTGMVITGKGNVQQWREDFRRRREAEELRVLNAIIEERAK